MAYEDDPGAVPTDVLVEDEYEGAERPRRSLALPLAVIAVVIIAWPLMQSFGGGSSDGAGSRDGYTIEAVEGHEPVEGAVSVWVAAGASIDAVLADAGISAKGRIDLGEGRWVVDVEPGSEVKAVQALSKTEGVHDAGRVYQP